MNMIEADWMLLREWVEAYSWPVAFLFSLVVILNTILKMREKK